ncbi:MAG: hypothetical protein ABI624_12855 [Casimicrobiaceae bacterium]
MLPPGFFTEARMRAPHFIQARVLSWTGVLNVRVTRVFRGNLRRGDQLALVVSIAGDEPLRLGDPTLWSYRKDVVSARYVEAFLDGNPPEVVCDQIKFLKRAWWWPSGDPSKEGFIW